MAVSMRSLLDYLRRAWEDFELDSLGSIYGGALREVLQHQFVLRDISGIPQYPFCEIHNEDSLESLLAKWNHCVVSDALSKSQDHLSGRFSTLNEVYMVRAGQAQYPGLDASYRPDWGAVQPSIRPGKPSTILPGDTKLSEKWRSDKIKRGPAKMTFMEGEWLRPLAQIYTYYIKANMRYGNITTDKELVVTRVKPMLPNGSQAIRGMPTSLDDIPADRALESGMLEYKPIPWNSNDDTQLSEPKAMTVNLGLWWLLIMVAGIHSIENAY
ncbi:MAG: hypothetical protein ALECFALPRED_003266 [Alectoria fallacina]|uniref:Uncharacterized protein n=1 Tax=Alectoria fallacina TaxID=1903189 RepID=A0A8H3FLH5_9LECA|nr:MAG: hypothetical protein ALECFALPRED_003266 [Alectoria fallacina]